MPSFSVASQVVLARGAQWPPIREAPSPEGTWTTFCFLCLSPARPLCGWRGCGAGGRPGLLSRPLCSLSLPGHSGQHGRERHTSATTEPPSVLQGDAGIRGATNGFDPLAPGSPRPARQSRLCWPGFQPRKQAGGCQSRLTGRRDNLGYWRLEWLSSENPSLKETRSAH